MIDLAGAWAKRDRASEHLEILRTELSSFTNSNSHGVSIESDDERINHIARIAFTPKPDFARWGLMIGDCAHNFRSALDHAVFRIAQVESGQELPPKHDKLMFLIAGTEDQFANWRWHIKTLSASTQAIIEGLQPCATGHPDPQSGRWLNELDIVDKHRVIPLTVLALAAGPADLHPGFDLTTLTGLKQSTMVTGGLQDDAPWLYFTTNGPDPMVKVKRTAPLFVAFPYGGNGGEKTAVLTVLESVRDEVDRILGVLGGI